MMDEGCFTVSLVQYSITKNKNEEEFRENINFVEYWATYFSWAFSFVSKISIRKELLRFRRKVGLAHKLYYFRKEGILRISKK